MNSKKLANHQELHSTPSSCLASPMPENAPPPDNENLTTGQRISGAIRGNPIGALILTTGIIAAVLYGALNQAHSGLNSAASRIDTIAREIGGFKVSLGYIEKEVGKLDEMSAGIVRIQNFNSSIDQQLRSLRSYEVRVIESFGIRVDENLHVEVNKGQIVAFPLTPEKKTEVQKAGFVESKTVWINRPVYALGYFLPVSFSADPVATGSIPQAPRQGRQ